MKIMIKDCAKKLKDWSLYRLAKELGLPSQTIYSWASGRTQPSYESWDNICAILDCRIEDLLQNEEIQQKLNFKQLKNS